MLVLIFFFFFSSRRRHTRWNCDWSSDVCSSDLDAPQNVRAIGYDRHVDLVWTPVVGDSLQSYEIDRSFDDKTFEPIGIQHAGIHRYSDFLGKPNQKVYYKVRAMD